MSALSHIVVRIYAQPLENLDDAPIITNAGGVAALQTPEVAAARAAAIGTAVAKARVAEPLPAMVWRVAQPSTKSGKMGASKDAPVESDEQQQQPAAQSSTSAAGVPKDPRKRLDPRLARRK